jgi:hypothetical protein
MAILIDPPLWPAHGRLWSHLVSDSSFEELHAFARAHGVPPRGFEGDHYDVPQDHWTALVAAGARPVPGRELLHRLRSAGLRRPKRRGELVLASHTDAAGARVDVLRSALAPTRPVRAVWVLAAGAAGVLAVPGPAGWTLPRAEQAPAGPVDAEPAEAERAPTDWVRLAAALAHSLMGASRPELDGWQQVGYLRTQPADGGPPRDVELVLRCGAVPPSIGGLRPPARWVSAAQVSQGSPVLAPLLNLC